MKRLLLTLAGLTVLVNPCLAGPYFRPIDYQHPQTSLGALVDPTSLGKTQTATLLALVTHSPEDGCFLPSIICEDWTPLAVGGAVNAGKLTFEVGPSANLSPVVKAAILAALNASTDKYDNLKSLLAPPAGGVSDLTMSFGPMLEVAPQEAWKGYFRVFAGAAWKW